MVHLTPSTSEEKTPPFFYCTTIITSQIQEAAERMEAAAKYNAKLTSLRIYEDCLGGFMSEEKQVL